MTSLIDLRSIKQSTQLNKGKPTKSSNSKGSPLGELSAQLTEGFTPAPQRPHPSSDCVRIHLPQRGRLIYRFPLDPTIPDYPRLACIIPAPMIP